MVIFFEILIYLGMLILSIFIIVYFFRLANDAREIKNTINDIKHLLVCKDEASTVKFDIKKSKSVGVDSFDDQSQESANIVGFEKIPIDGGSFLYFDSKNGQIPSLRIGIEVFKIDGSIPCDGIYKIQNKNEKYEVINGVLRVEYYVESYKTNVGETIDIECNRMTGAAKGSRVYINNIPAQDGVYKIGLVKKIKVKDGLLE